MTRLLNLALLFLLLAGYSLSAGNSQLTLAPTALPELLNILAEKALLPALSSKDDAALAQNVLLLLGIPAVPLPLKVEAVEQAPICLPGDTGEVYLRLADFQHLPKADWEDCLELLPKDKCRGVILDLRGSKGFQVEVAEFYQQQLLGLEVPIMILIDGETAGTAETLAVNLRQKGNALLLGQKSTGIQGAGQEIILANGIQFRCPTIVAGKMPSPVVPDVELPNSGASQYKRLAYVSPASDPWSLHAAATLTMILTLSE